MSRRERAFGEQIDLWTSEGLITPHLAGTLKENLRSSRPETGRAAEAFGYAGAVIVISALAVLLRDVWGGLSTQGQAAVTLATAVALVLGSRASGESPAGSRLRSLLLVSAVGMSLTSAGLALSLTSAGETTAELALTGLALVLTGAAYLSHRRALTHAAFYAGALTATFVWFENAGPLPSDHMWEAILTAGFGLSWLLIAASGRLQPPQAGVLLGAATLLVSLQALSSEGTLPLLLTILTGAVMMWAGTASGERVLAVFGGVSVAVNVPQLVFRWFGPGATAASVLLLMGLVVIVLAVRNLRRPGRATQDKGAEERGGQDGAA